MSAPNRVVKGWRERPTVRAAALMIAVDGLLDQLQEREVLPVELRDHAAELRQQMQAWLDWAAQLEPPGS